MKIHFQQQPWYRCAFVVLAFTTISTRIVVEAQVRRDHKPMILGGGCYSSVQDNTVLAGTKTGLIGYDRGGDGQ